MRRLKLRLRSTTRKPQDPDDITPTSNSFSSEDDDDDHDTRDLLADGTSVGWFGFRSVRLEAAYLEHSHASWSPRIKVLAGCALAMFTLMSVASIADWRGFLVSSGWPATPMDAAQTHAPTCVAIVVNVGLRTRLFSPHRFQTFTSLMLLSIGLSMLVPLIYGLWGVEGTGTLKMHSTDAGCPTPEAEAAWAAQGRNVSSTLTAQGRNDPARACAAEHSGDTFNMFQCRKFDGYSGSSAPGSWCVETCTSHAADGHCDDGGEGAEYSACAFGTDCIDCGARLRTDHFVSCPYVKDEATAVARAVQADAAHHFAMTGCMAAFVSILPCGPYAPIGPMLLATALTTLLSWRFDLMSKYYHGLGPIDNVAFFYVLLLGPALLLGLPLRGRSERARFLASQLSRLRSELRLEQLQVEKERLDYERRFALHELQHRQSTSKSQPPPQQQQHRRPSAAAAPSSSGAPSSVTDVELALLVADLCKPTAAAHEAAPGAVGATNSPAPPSSSGSPGLGRLRGELLAARREIQKRREAASHHAAPRRAALISASSDRASTSERAQSDHDQSSSTSSAAELGRMQLDTDTDIEAGDGAVGSSRSSSAAAAAAPARLLPSRPQAPAQGSARAADVAAASGSESSRTTCASEVGQPAAVAVAAGTSGSSAATSDTAAELLTAFDCAVGTVGVRHPAARLFRKGKRERLSQHEGTRSREGAQPAAQRPPTVLRTIAHRPRTLMELSRVRTPTNAPDEQQKQQPHPLLEFVLALRGQRTHGPMPGQMPA